MLIAWSSFIRMRMGEKFSSATLSVNSTSFTKPRREAVETLAVGENFSPLFHRIDQAVRWRAVHPDEPLPPPSAKLTQASQPPEELQSHAKKYLDRLIAIANVKKGPSICLNMLSKCTWNAWC
jgi:hypothetical protein